jgi:ABC-type transport system substrate-binding protein
LEEEEIMSGKKGMTVCSVAAVMLLLLVMMAPAGLQAQVKKWPKFGEGWMVYDERYWPTKPVRGGYYRVARTRYVGMLNPNHWPVTDWASIGYLYDLLMISDADYLPSTPWLAESVEYENPLTAVMKLRSGVKFNDGTTLNASSLKYQVEWIKDKKNGAWTRAWLAPVKSVEIVDEYTVKWHFKEPWAAFLGIMANIPGYTLSEKALRADGALRESGRAAAKIKAAKKALAREEAKAKKAEEQGGKKAEKAKAKVERARKKLAKLEKKAEEWAVLAKGAKKYDTNPIGCGPYVLEEARPGNYLKVKRNPDWWFGKKIGMPDMPYFDGILVTVIPDPSVQLANLRAGKIDSLSVDKSQHTMVKKDPNLKVYVYPHPNLLGYAFNHAEGPCKDIRVRKAISHAIDRKGLITGTQFGLGRIASCLYPVDHWAHNPDLKPVSFDPELSKKILAEAGYAKGLTITGFFPNTTMGKNLAEAAKGMLAEVGINWKVDFLDAAAVSDRIKNTEGDFNGMGWAYIADPDMSATGLYHPSGGFNYGRSRNEEAIALIEAGRTELDLKKRQKIYWELEKALYENYEDVWVLHGMRVDAYRKNVMGFNLDMRIKGFTTYERSHPLWFKDGKP